MPLQEDQTQKLKKSAYHLWVLAGRPAGREAEFGQRDARLPMQEDKPVLNDDLDMAGRDSFPASDPVNHT